MSMRLSKSKVSSYEMCPRQYYLRNVLRIPQAEMPQLKLGTTLHEKYERFFNALPDKIENEKQITETFEKVCLPDNLPKEKEHLENFLSMNLNTFHDLNKKDLLQYFKPIAVEKKYYDEELDFVGVIDAVFKLDDKVLIVDWKSSNYKDGKESYYRFELSVYKSLWDKFNPDLKATHWGIGFSGNNVFWVEEVKSVSMQAMYKKIERVRQAIKDKKFDKKPRALCQWCGYFDYCWEGDLNE